MANLNLHRALGVGFLWSGTTLPGWRGRGVYRALLGARCRWAASQGLRRVGVYANRHTSGPVVTRLGFDRHGPLELWDRVGPAPGGQS